MAHEPVKDRGFLPQILYILLIPPFFLGSSLLYNPFDIKGYYSFGSYNFGFHLVMISCIILMCLLITRLSFYLILKKMDVKWRHYGVWCIGEMAIITAFVALYTELFKGGQGGYFDYLAECIKFIYLLLIYPYTFLILLSVVNVKNEELAQKSLPSSSSLIRFYDEHKRLKLSIAPSSILYVISEFNYVKIHYLDAGKVKSYMLRASMKSLEAINSRCLVRCQRSYFVNPEHVTVLRKDSNGFIFAEMNIPEVPAVPVSKQYYSAVASLL